MCNLSEAIEERGLERGLEQGLERGKEAGEELFAILTEKLLKDSRTEDLLRATKDREFRNGLYREYQIK